MPSQLAVCDTDCPGRSVSDVGDRPASAGSDCQIAARFCEMVKSVGLTSIDTGWLLTFVSVKVNSIGCPTW